MRRLVAEARQGDRGAADRLVRQHAAWVRSAIYAVTGRIDLVDDIAQQVWVRVWERLETLQDTRRLRSWLYTVARNAAIDACMSDRRRKDALGRFEEAPRPDRRPIGPERIVVSGELQQTLRQAVESLPAIYREPFVLRHLEDWSYAEIGEVMSLSVETVETRLARARRLLREMLQGRVER